MIFIIDDDFSICAFFDISTVIEELRKILQTSNRAKDIFILWFTYQAGYLRLLLFRANVVPSKNLR